MDNRVKQRLEDWELNSTLNKSKKTKYVPSPPLPEKYGKKPVY